MGLQVWQGQLAGQDLLSKLWVCEDLPAQSTFTSIACHPSSARQRGLGHFGELLHLAAVVTALSVLLYLATVVLDVGLLNLKETLIHVAYLLLHRADKTRAQVWR